VKKRILITSILLGLTTAVLIGYFVAGCSSLEDIVSRENEPQDGVREVVNETDTETQVAPVVAAQPQEPKDGADRLDELVGQDVVDKEDSKPPILGDMPLTSSLSRELTYPEGWRGGHPEPGEKPAPPTHVGTPRSGRQGEEVGLEGRKRHSRVVAGADRKDYNERSGPVSRARPADTATDNGYGMMGGGYGGGMGGRTWYDARSTGPQATRKAPGLSRLRVAEGLHRRKAGPSGSVSVRSVPVELINVSADELWIIAKSEVQPVPLPPDDDGPGCGAMLAKLPKEDKKIPLPLKRTDVKGQISGYIATVDVTQQFHNPYDEKIEAVYVFPLPQNAAINEFIMTIGERRIRGIIRERKEAEKIYRHARSQGYVASLLTQERPNIFTQKVANIEPSKQIDVNIKYFNTLAYVDGWYEFVFPMVVGPRFNPPGFTDGVGAVARGKAGISGQKTEVQYLKPGERSGHDISLAVDIDAGVDIEKLVCKSHVITNSSASRQCHWALQIRALWALPK